MQSGGRTLSINVKNIDLLFQPSSVHAQPYCRTLGANSRETSRQSSWYRARAGRGAGRCRAAWYRGSAGGVHTGRTAVVWWSRRPRLKRLFFIAGAARWQGACYHLCRAVFIALQHAAAPRCCCCTLVMMWPTLAALSVVFPPCRRSRRNLFSAAARRFP